MVARVSCSVWCAASYCGDLVGRGSVGGVGQRLHGGVDGGVPVVAEVLDGLRRSGRDAGPAGRRAARRRMEPGPAPRRTGRRRRAAGRAVRSGLRSRTSAAGRGRGAFAPVVLAGVGACAAGAFFAGADRLRGAPGRRRPARRRLLGHRLLRPTRRLGRRRLRRPPAWRRARWPRPTACLRPASRPPARLRRRGAGPGRAGSVTAGGGPASGRRRRRLGLAQLTLQLAHPARSARRPRRRWPAPPRRAPGPPRTAPAWSAPHGWPRRWRPAPRPAPAAGRRSRRPCRPASRRPRPGPSSGTPPSGPRASSRYARHASCMPRFLSRAGGVQVPRYRAPRDAPVRYGAGERVAMRRGGRSWPAWTSAGRRCRIWRRGWTANAETVREQARPRPHAGLPGHRPGRRFHGRLAGGRLVDIADGDDPKAKIALSTSSDDLSPWSAASSTSPARSPPGGCRSRRTRSTC